MGNICCFEIQVDTDRIDRNKTWYVKRKISREKPPKAVFYKGEYYHIG
jgi:hypothetical protein